MALPDGPIVAHGAKCDEYRFEWAIVASTDRVTLWLPDPGYSTMYRIEKSWRYSDEPRHWWKRKLPTFLEACESAFRFGESLQRAREMLTDKIEVARILANL